MARVTVEDCVIRIPNRFELVMVAAQRARELSVGGQLTVDRDNDKNPVVALREIADATVDIDGLGKSLVKGLQKHVEVDEPVDEAAEVLAVEEALSESGGFQALTAVEADGEDNDDDEGDEAELGNVAGGADDVEEK